MFRWIGRVVYRLLVLISIMLACGMLACTYCTLLNPIHYPLLNILRFLFPFFLVANLLVLIFWIFVKWRTAIIPLVALVACWGGIRAYVPFNIPQTPPDDAIKILSYNTCMFGKHNRWKDVCENEIHQYIRQSGADIVCLQEMMNIDSTSYYKLDDIYPYSTVSHFPTLSRLAIFSKYPLIDTLWIQYPTTNNNSVLYHLLVDGDTVSVINNHLESLKLNPEEKKSYDDMIVNKDVKKKESKVLFDRIIYTDSIRAYQADILHDIVAEELERHGNVIFCGDFNDSPISYVHQRLTRLLRDAFSDSGNGLAFSYQNYHMYIRIDHILHSPNYESFGTKVDKSIKTSDHYPIFTYLRKKDKKVEK